MPDRRRRINGFTIVELIMILIILGVLAAVALPMLNQGTIYRGASFRDEVVAALRYGQKTAVSHLRLVCASLTATSVTLTIASRNIDTTCSATTLPGPDGAAAYAQSLDAANVKLDAYPSTIYFQTSGSITDAGGARLSTDITFVNGAASSIRVEGSTGYID